MSPAHTIDEDLPAIEIPACCRCGTILCEGDGEDECMWCVEEDRALRNEEHPSLTVGERNPSLGGPIWR